MSNAPVSAAELHARYTALIAAREPVAVATVVKGAPLGSKLLIAPDGTLGTLGHARLDAQAETDARELLAAEKSDTKAYLIGDESEPREVYIETVPPPPLLLIFGAVHVAQALTRFAKALGFAVIVVDIRSKLATPERFPLADEIIHAWPDDAMQGITVHPNTCIAILSHDPKFDEPALLGALASPAAYIGAIGSRQTNVDRRDRLAAAGMTPDQIARVRGPIGLDIGAVTPEEMAISILAEIIAVRQGRGGGMLTSASGHIRGSASDAREPAPATVIP